MENFRLNKKSDEEKKIFWNKSEKGESYIFARKKGNYYENPLHFMVGKLATIQCYNHYCLARKRKIVRHQENHFHFMVGQLVTIQCYKQSCVARKISTTLGNHYNFMEFSKRLNIEQSNPRGEGGRGVEVKEEI